MQSRENVKRVTELQDHKPIDVIPANIPESNEEKESITAETPPVKSK